MARLAASFNDSAARIESLVAAQKSLLANASHELRSPLARIRMAAELLAEQAAPAIRAELRRNVTELDQLIDEVLLASRLEAIGTDMTCPEEVDLTGLLAEDCARVGAELDARAHSIVGEPKLLRRMVRNLLENAVRYGAGSVVDAQLGIGGIAALRLEVRDGGPGIPESEREHFRAVLPDRRRERSGGRCGSGPWSGAPGRPPPRWRRAVHAERCRQLHTCDVAAGPLSFTNLYGAYMAATSPRCIVGAAREPDMSQKNGCALMASLSQPTEPP